MFQLWCKVNLIMEFNNEIKINFGDKIKIDGTHFILPVVVNDNEISVDDIKVIIELCNVQDRILHKLHIDIMSKYQNLGLKYRIIKEFVCRFGNIYRQSQ